MFLMIHAIGNSQRLQPGKNSRTGIPFLYGIVPILFVTGKFYINLTFLHFCFLYTKYIGIDLRKKIDKTFI